MTSTLLYMVYYGKPSKPGKPDRLIDINAGFAGLPGFLCTCCDYV